jgi:3-deoxy-D-manno-octulosonic acid (KDO) 8-phosphate synthase
VISEEDNNPSLIHNTRSTDMPYLRYLSLSKAEIIEKINSRGEKLKKSLALFSQINKYFEATKITQVNKPNWL